MADGEQTPTGDDAAAKGDDKGTTPAPEKTDQEAGKQEPGTGSEPAKKTETGKPAEDGKGTTAPSDSPELTAARKAAEAQRKRADALEKEKRDREEQELKDKGEHEKLAQQADERAKKAEEGLQTARQDNALIAAASAAGIKDSDAALKLVDRENVTVNDDGTVTGAEAAMKALVEAKPYLTNSNAGKTAVGAGTNPAGGEATQEGEAKTFTEKQISDVKFFRENEKEITKAVREGRIVKDDAAS